MHPNPIYRGAEAATNLAFARRRGFGMLTIAGPDGPLASHIPFVMSDDGAVLNAHIVRSNPIRMALEAGPLSALVAISGPDGYISPDWYGMVDQVPTWNYVAVHLRGQLSLAPPESLRAHLDALAANFEVRIAGKKPWTAAKMTPEALDRLMRMILPVTMTVEQIDGTWKFSQNKPPEARLGAADGVAGTDLGMELEALAALMRAAG